MVAQINTAVTQYTLMHNNSGGGNNNNRPNSKPYGTKTRVVQTNTQILLYQIRRHQYWRSVCFSKIRWKFSFSFVNANVPFLNTMERNRERASRGVVANVSNLCVLFLCSAWAADDRPRFARPLSPTCGRNGFNIYVLCTVTCFRVQRDKLSQCAHTHSEKESFRISYES